MHPDFNTVLMAFLLTLFAGLSTGIGSAIAFFAKKTNTKFLTVQSRVLSGSDDLCVICGTFRTGT